MKKVITDPGVGPTAALTPKLQYPYSSRVLQFNLRSLIFSDVLFCLRFSPFHSQTVKEIISQTEFVFKNYVSDDKMIKY